MQRPSAGPERRDGVSEVHNEYLDVNEWQVAGVKQATTSLDRGEGVSHQEVRG